MINLSQTYHKSASKFIMIIKNKNGFFYIVNGDD